MHAGCVWQTLRALLCCCAPLADGREPETITGTGVLLNASSIKDDCLAQIAVDASESTQLLYDAPHGGSRHIYLDKQFIVETWPAGA